MSAISDDQAPAPLDLDEIRRRAEPGSDVSALLAEIDRLNDPERENEAVRAWFNRQREYTTNQWIALYTNKGWLILPKSNKDGAIRYTDDHWGATVFTEDEKAEFEAEINHGGRIWWQTTDRLLDEHEKSPINCMTCGQMMVRWRQADHRTEPTYEHDKALSLIFGGGYGWFCDPMFDHDRKITICHDCAHRVCDVLNIGEFAAMGHGHDEAYFAAHPDHRDSHIPRGAEYHSAARAWCAELRAAGCFEASEDPGSA